MNDRDFAAGVPLQDLVEGTPLFGKLGDEAVMLVRYGDEVSAFSATCTHYSGPLGEGMVTGEVIRCPWHHACFSLRTGEAVAAPALNPLRRYPVRIRDGVVIVGGPSSVVIVGAGAAGSAAAATLRRERYDGAITMIDPDADAPYDRPNLSKDFLAGHAPEEWLPLPPVDVQRMVATVTALDTSAHTLTLDNGEQLRYDALLLTTGAAPIIPNIPGADMKHVHVLRSLQDCRRLISAVAGKSRVVVAGASFIGMEVAASLRQRGLEVTVVAPESVPFARTLGEEVGAHLRNVHENNGVRFMLGRTVKAIGAQVLLDDNTSLECDVVVLGIGVRPNLALAQAAGIKTENGVLVDEHLRTSAPDVFAAGDIANVNGTRVEHWVVAQRQGQTAARNILGGNERFASIPFFWTQQFDVPVAYVGHAREWDRVEVDGSIQANDCAVSYRRGNELLAVLTIGRDQQSLQTEIAMEKKS